MKLNFVNRTAYPKWNHYRNDLKQMLANTIRYFSLSDELAVSCVLVDDAQMVDYNATFRQRNQTTDVLTFVDDEDSHYLGDVIINVDALVRQAQAYNHTLKRELSFLFVHGLLHALGYHHETQADEAAMLAHQKEILKDVSKRSYRKLSP
ncbi:MAG: rRNA maturation RNase YbeY [Erysipelothrix sp.]|jgi:probable rRNA maturation factor|nr:rRNA maturation RNase YbeY [Erysipelothrix sp.]